MRSSQTMGDEWPRPGTGTFQRTFSVSDQRSGYPVPSTTPCPDGPRQRDHQRAPSPSGGTMRTPAESWAAAGGARAASMPSATVMAARRREAVLLRFTVLAPQWLIA